MQATVQTVFCITLLACTSAAQQGQPSAQDLLVRGKQTYLQEGPKQALPDLEQALNIFRAHNDRRGEAVALGYIATCHRRLENLDKALEFGQQALRLKEELGDRGEMGSTHNQLGLIYWERAEYPEAIEHLNRAIEIASSIGDKELEGSALNNLGLVWDEEGDHRKALDHYQQALKVNRAAHFERGESDALGDIGGVYLLLGRFREAIPYYKQAFEISQRLGLKPSSSMDLGNMALCLAGIGDVEGAIKNFDRALEIAHQSGMAKEEADWRKGKGSTLTGLGRFDAALEEYAAAEQVYEQAGLRRELLEALLDTGKVDELLGDGAAAQSRFQRALQLAREIGNKSGETAGLVALGDLERRRKKYDSAEAYFQQAIQQSRAAGDEGIIFEALMQRAMNDIDRKHYSSALEIASEANQIAESLGNMPAMALSRYVLGEVQRSQGQLSAALDHYASALILQEQLRDPELGWRILYGRGQALASQQKLEDAVTSFKSAINIIEGTRSGIAEERYRAGYMEDRYQVYVALVEILLKLQRADEAFLYSEKLRACAYFDKLGIARHQTDDPDSQQHIQELGEQIRTLRQVLGKEYAVPQDQRHGPDLQLYSTELNRAEREYAALIDASGDLIGKSKETSIGSILSAAQVQRHLPAKAALVEYVVGRETVSILVVTSTSIIGLPIGVTSQSLYSRSELLHDLTVARNEGWIEPARGLRKLLIDPIENTGCLSGVQQLLIVPDSVLNYIPFAALPLGRQQYLGDKFTITYLPAAAALAKGRKAGGGKLLAMAPSDTHLPNAPAEVRGIGQIFGPEARVIVGKKATKTLFKQIAGDYDYVHLATHGSLNRNAPMLSALELEPDGQNDGRLEVYEIAGLNLHARLITLSACESGLGTGYFSETPGGDEFVGLTRAFLSAGGQNVLASLWAVNDQSTRELMVRLYRHLLASGGARALAKAQRELRNSDSRYRHPYYWAGFVISGSIE